ncbi:MlaA family lipoprotein [Shimia ponticola]|uniref:MlaA family lipoprotein n=1 Tax=Shimia ponticola TaxID=2582893 RepID=UPI0011BED816|nr:VacJ family lipoprotein [Shimia ponticola]
MPTSSELLTVAKRAAAVMAVVAVAGCAATPEGVDIHDPYEASNREAHAFNKKIDRGALRPAGNVYGALVPDPIDQGVQNFADNLGEPQNVLNYTLQGNLPDAVEHSLRFLVNTTAGVFGLFDVASAIGFAEDDTDFGETLHVWGVQEGAYLEVAFLGPTNERDLAGTFVDMFTDPVSFVVRYPEKGYVTAAKVGGVLDQRYEFGETVDSILYDSADSYAQLRLLSVQNRRFELGQAATTATAAGEEDLYDDSYFE